ncbi:MAG TPA: DUF5808 domain-containing protein [Myxococcaceae bacterium]|nr:DUF5808 domain-containing protein [Myxococcaceae bacterium]
MKLRSLGPYLLLLVPAVALVLFADRFPSPMPVHWDASGRPNGYFPRTPVAMAFPLLLFGGILLVLDFIQASGARTGPPAMTEAVGRMLAPVRWLLALMALPTAFAPIWGPIPVLVAAVVLVLVIGIQVARAPRMAPSDGEGWNGLLYVNPADPRLVVPKRSGLGWTFNFAKPIAWVIFTALLLGPLAIVGAMILRAAAHR